MSFWILSAASRLQRVVNEELSPHGVTYRQLEVLGTLAFHGEVSQTELAERIQVEPSTVVRIIDRMERDGWVERIPSPTDRRVKLVRATDKVAPVWEVVRSVGGRIIGRATSGLTPEDVGQLIESLRVIHTNLGGKDDLGDE